MESGEMGCEVSELYHCFWNALSKIGKNKEFDRGARN